MMTVRREFEQKFELPKKRRNIRREFFGKGSFCLPNWILPDHPDVSEEEESYLYINELADPSKEENFVESKVSKLCKGLLIILIKNATYSWKDFILEKCINETETVFYLGKQIADSKMANKNLHWDSIDKEKPSTRFSPTLDVYYEKDFDMEESIKELRNSYEDFVEFVRENNLESRIYIEEDMEYGGDDESVGRRTRLAMLYFATMGKHGSVHELLSMLDIIDQVNNLVGYNLDGISFLGSRHYHWYQMNKCAIQFHQLLGAEKFHRIFY